MGDNLRSIILKGFAAANRIHEKYDLVRFKEAGDIHVDVFDIINQEGILLCFSPLEKLHGAYIPSVNGKAGILINSREPLHRQRFTAAHELGHHVLGHKTSVDTTFLGRAPMPSDKYEEPSIDADQEREADGFASALLMPKWLILKHLIRIKENTNFLKNDLTLYQMSLRLGVSYVSFCWGLLVHEIFSWDEAKHFAGLDVKDIKKKIVPEEILKTNPWANVWIVNEKFAGVKMLGDKNDLFVFELNENPSTGYIWDYSHFSNYGLRLLKDDFAQQHSEAYGADIQRRLIFTNESLLVETLPIFERRMWNDETSGSLSLNFSVSGKGTGFYKKIGFPNVA